MVSYNNLQLKMFFKINYIAPRNSKEEKKHTVVGNCLTRCVNVMWNIVPLGEGNGNSLHYSCLENPLDGGAWWAAVHRVAQSQT